MESKLEEARDFLEERFGEISRLEVLRGGEWSQAFGFCANGRDLVIRFGKYAEDFHKDRAAFRISSPDLPIPEVLEIGAALGGHFCISQRVFGEMLDGLNLVGMKRIVPALLRALDALRFSDPDLLLDPSAGSWSDQLLSVDEETERVSGWHDRMATSPTGVEAYQKGLNYLRAHRNACIDANHVVHNDLLHFNVLVSSDSIVGVIDWGNAVRGDFLYDLAMFTFYAPWYPSMKGIDWLGEAKRHFSDFDLQIPELEQRMRCYEVHLGLSGIAYAAFKGNWRELERNARQVMLRIAT